MKALLSTASFALLLLSTNGASAFDEFRVGFLRDQADAASMRASTTNDFEACASAYIGAIEAGARNPTIYYNAGTALLMAGRHEDALDLLRRAEHYTGTTWEIGRNMIMAERWGSPDQRAELPWYRIPLFWHFRLPCSTRAGVAALAFLLFWAGMIARLFGARRTGSSMALAAAIVTAVFASSTLATVYSHSTSLPPASREHSPPAGANGMEVRQ